MNDAKYQSRMRFQEMNLFCDVTIAELQLSPRAVATWLVLFRHADTTGKISVSDITIGRLLGCTDRAVRRATDELERKGVLLTKRKGIPGQASVRYLKIVTPKDRTKSSALSRNEDRTKSSGEDRTKSSKSADDIVRQTEGISPSGLFLTERDAAPPRSGSGRQSSRAEQKKAPHATARQ